jgi:hypothetical protein
MFVAPQSQKQLQNKRRKESCVECRIFARFDFRVEKYVYVDQGEFKDGSNPPRFEKFLKLLLNV